MICRERYVIFYPSMQVWYGEDRLHLTKQYAKRFANIDAAIQRAKNVASINEKFKVFRIQKIVEKTVEQEVNNET